MRTVTLLLLTACSAFASGPDPAATCGHVGAAHDEVELGRVAWLRDLEQAIRRRSNRQQLPANHATVWLPKVEDLEGVPVWTDDYSDLVSVLGPR